MRPTRPLSALATAALMLSMTACTAELDLTQLEGTWRCESRWTWEKAGEAIPCSATWTVTSRAGKTVSQGTLSLGDAQWEGTSEGIGRASGHDLHHTRTSHTATPQNDAARAFERDVLGGQALDTIGVPPSPHLRILTLTDTDLVAINNEGRRIICTRPEAERPR